MTLPLAILFLIMAVGCYSISQLQQHGKLKWGNYAYGFWGTNSSWLKYKPVSNEGFALVPAPDTWYYQLNKLKYKEKFFLSATWLAFTTDGYHFMQFWMFNFLSLSVTLFYGWNWWIFGGVMIKIRLINWLTRKLFSK